MGISYRTIQAFKEFGRLQDQPFLSDDKYHKSYATMYSREPRACPPKLLTFIWRVRWPCYLSFKFCEVFVHQVHLYLVFASLKGGKPNVRYGLSRKGKRKVLSHQI